MSDDELVARCEILQKENEVLKNKLRQHKKAVRKYREERALKPYQGEIIKLQQHLERTNTRMIILFEGRDAAGKGGTIRRITRYMNEKHYRIVALGKPTQLQTSQWYFQRYVEQFPRGGEIVLFDRSWYNRAMVESVFNFCTAKQYQDFMAGVTEFETDLVRQGTILLKLYFSVTKDVQAQRFKRRKTDPLRQWKLSEVDLQAQNRWNDFTNAKYKMLQRTHTAIAPWTVVRSDNKHVARLNTMKVLLNVLFYKGRRDDLDFQPDPKVIVSGARELEFLEDLLKQKQ